MKQSLQVCDEEERVTLGRYGIIESQSGESFDAIVQLAATICNTSISSITLVDETRPRFNSHIGLDMMQISREIASCHLTLKGTQLWVVPDILMDKRFRDNLPATGEPQIRFYAGMPLVTPDGVVIGTLSVLDPKPRYGLTDHQRDCLHLLARDVMTHMKVRRELMVCANSKCGLQDTNIELEAFSAAVAHDLRAPLRLIESYADLLGEEFPEVSKTINPVAAVRHECTRMRNIIDALLRLSRVEHTDLHRTDVDLTALVRGLTDELQAAEPTRRFQFVIASGIKAYTDEGMMRLLLTNLLSNAAKFTRVRTEAYIEFGTLNSAMSCEYFIRDNGIGVDQAAMIIPSKPFTQRHSVGDSAYVGVGLGLTIVQRIISRHNGTIRAEGGIDTGMMIAFTLGC